MTQGAFGLATFRLALMGMTAAALAGCAAPSGGEGASDAALAAADCPDDGARLPLSGVCSGRAYAYMDELRAPAAAPDGCDWVAQETAMPAGEVLLYLALNCGAQTAALAYSGGAQFAELTYAHSALTGDTRDGERFALIGTADPTDPAKQVQFYARQAMDAPAAAQACFARPLGDPEWPSDAYVVDLLDPPPALDAPPEPNCGPLGAEMGGNYWRVFDGRSWYFELGQDAWQDVDPASLTVLRP